MVSSLPETAEMYWFNKGKRFSRPAALVMVGRVRIMIISYQALFSAKYFACLSPLILTNTSQKWEVIFPFYK